MGVLSSQYIDGDASMYQPFPFEVNVVLPVPFPHAALASRTPDGGPPAGTALLSTSRRRIGLERHDLVALRDQFLEARMAVMFSRQGDAAGDDYLFDTEGTGTELTDAADPILHGSI